MINNTVEILAPAGSMDSLIAAVRCGAQAVYLGAGNFNARRHADNFSEDELRQAVEYCHVRGVKVYLTLNTLLSDAEISSALELISCVCALGVDALIIQDLGIARLCHEVAPDMPLHASTQMSVTSVYGFKELEALGFKRAVLPRELSFEEIKEIRENTSMELEVFVHGALCMCVSGQCYLSGMLGGRSGNRGLCAQPCRLPFAAPGGLGADLSLKDLSLIDHLPELIDLGIESFKIEGRMKRPEYVAAAVSACKEVVTRYEKSKKFDKKSYEIDYSGVPTQAETKLKEQLRAVFSRSGFTDGYYMDRLGKGMFGTRQKDDVTAAAPVLKELARLYDHEPSVIPISLSLTAELKKPLMASASTGKINTFVTSNYKVQKAQNHATEVDKIRDQLHKTGGTPFKVEMTDIKVDEDINIPLSEINNIRRLALESLEKKLIEGYKKSTVFSEYKLSIDDYTKTALLELGTHSIVWKKRSPSATRPNSIVRFSSVDQIPQNFDSFIAHGDYGVTSIIIPLFTTEDKYCKVKKFNIPFGVELPRALYGSLRDIKRKLKDAKKEGASFAYCGTLDGVSLAKSLGFRVMGAPTLNVYNSFALAEFDIHSIVVSTELELSSIGTLRGSLPRGIVAYGQTPLMLVRNCPIKNGRNCRACQSKLCLADRKGIKFPVTCEANLGAASEILNSRPIYLADRQAELKNLDFQLLYFSVEDQTKVSKVLSAFRDQTEPHGEFTRGLYYRGVE